MPDYNFSSTSPGADPNAEVQAAANLGTQFEALARCVLCCGDVASEVRHDPPCQTVFQEEQSCPELQPEFPGGFISPHGTANLGLSCMQVRHTLPGVSFEELLEVCKALVNPKEPREFQQIVKTRSVLRDLRYADNSGQMLVFSTVINSEILPKALSGYLWDGPLLCVERWNIYFKERKTSVEITNESGTMQVTLRIEVEASGENACEVDSQFFVQPTSIAMTLPPGLQEGLSEAYNMHSEKIRNIVVQLADNANTHKPDSPLPDGI